ncbi:hypothetical protein EAE99_008421 [Botrytis elliptica]|nr:hypothetical protein EAE99_008421 [Botrytis elliptica]
MDPLSVSASISGLISILDLIAGKSYKYVKEVRGSTQEVKKLVNEMTDLYGILNQLRLVVSRFDDESISSTIQFQHIDTCRALLDRIKERLDKADRDNIGGQKSAIGRKISNLGRALIWPFSVGETRALIDDVTTQKSTLMFALQVDGMNALFDALSDRKTQGLNIEAIQANVLGLRNEKAISMLNQKQKKIIKWIAPYDPSQRHQEIATKLRQPGTGQWFTKGDPFKSWLNEKASKLWLYGIRKHSFYSLDKLTPVQKSVLMLVLAGAGKTILISTISCIFDQLEDGDCLAFFYCDYKDTKTQDPLNILGSLVKQLVLADRRGFAELEACWVNCCPDEDIGISNPISAEHLCELLRNISRYFDNVHLVVDALDECGDGRLDIVRLLTELNATKDSNIKIILASRPEPDIESHLVDFTKLSIAAHRNDLELYVHSKIECRLRETQKIPWNQELREEVAQRLVDEAQGMFRWVTCQLDRLYDIDTLRGVRRALHSLPPTLFETYERILDRINLSSDETKELVRRVLIWTVCAVEPLSLAQLLEAVSIDLSDKHLDRDGIPNEQSILKRCSSLVRKTEGPWGIRIELAHFSVKEFLLLEVQDDRYSMYRTSQDFRNTYMAKVCLTYLLFEDFQDVTPHTTPTEKSATDKKYAFYRYASCNFVSHACSDADDDNILELLKLLFDPIKMNSFVFWVQELLIHYHDWNSRQKIICHTSTLHFAILLSIPHVVEWLISDTDTYSYLTNNGDFGTLLACAIAPEMVLYYVVEDTKCRRHPHPNRKKKILESLFQSATIIDPFSLTTCEWGNFPFTNLLELAIKAHFGWDILLQHGALITDSCIKALEEDFEDSYDFVTSFVQSTNPKNVPADINSRFMQFAGKLKNVDKPLVDSFFDSSVDIDSTEAIAALHAAITFGQTYNVLKVLKKWNPSINSCSNIDGLSALHRASKGGHLEIVKILLEHGASLDLLTSTSEIETVHEAYDIKYGDSSLKSLTSFHLAVENGKLEVAKFLQRQGADINKPDISGVTPIHSATGKDLNMMEYLLRCPGQRHSFFTKTSKGWTILMAAVRLGSSDVFRFVLRNSNLSIVQCQDKAGVNCLHEAVQSTIEPELKITILGDLCADLCTPTKDGFTPLHFAAKTDSYTFEKVLKYTLQSSSWEYQGLTSLRVMTKNTYLQGSDSRWDVLNDTQDIINVVSNSGSSVLHMLIHRGYTSANNGITMLRLLLSSNLKVNLELKDNEERSALLILCNLVLENYHRSECTNDFVTNSLKLLLQHGAMITQQDREGNTALHYLCKSQGFTNFEYRCISILLAAERWRLADTPENESIYIPKCMSADDSYGRNDGEDRGDYGADGDYWNNNKRADEDDDDNDLMTKIEHTRVHLRNNYCNLSEIPNRSNRTALHIFFAQFGKFCHQRFTSKIALMLVSAASVDQLNSTFVNGRSLLNIALHHRQDQLSKMLLDLGVDTLHPDKGMPPRTALELLCIHGSQNKSLIERIIASHLDRDYLNFSGYTMLDLACLHLQPEVLNELLRVGWNAEALDGRGLPPIAAAIQSGDTNSVKSLLRYGAVILNIYQASLFSLSLAPNSVMCKLLDENGINDWHCRTSGHFWGQFVPGLSTTQTINDSTMTEKKWLLKIDSVTPLHQASIYGTKETIQYALEFGINMDVDVAASFGITPLFFAIYGKKPDITELLLSKGAATNVIYGPRKLTPLHLAVAGGNELIVETLLQYGADVQARDGTGLTPATLALGLKYESIARILNKTLAKLLISAPICPNNNISATETDRVDGNTYVSVAIEDAIVSQDLSTLKYLVQNGDSIEGACFCGCSPLLRAFVRSSSRETIHYLLDNGASLDGVVTCTEQLPTSGFTPLHYAAMLGDEQIMEKILTLGKPTPQQKVHPLHVAAYNGHSACVRLLLNYELENKCGIDMKSDVASPRCFEEAQIVSNDDHVAKDIGGTALHYASFQGHLNTMKELLKAGADPNARNRWGETPLHIAAEDGQYQACQVLISAGASVLSRDFYNFCPIHDAISGEHQRIVQVMIKELVSFDIFLDDGSNLLAYACRNGNAETIEILIAAGMNINSTDNYEWPAFFSAMLSQTLTEEFQMKLLANVDNLYQTHKTESLLTILCRESLLLVVRELLRRMPKDKLYQYVNYISLYGTALYRTAAMSREQNLKIAELLIEYGAELEIIKPSHGTPLMGACYYGCYDMVALLLKKGARTTCNKRDGTQMTAVEEARHHPDIVSLLKNFEEKGIEALNEPRPARLANMVRVEECMNRISEEEEQEEDQEKEKKRNEEGETEESKEEGCEQK